MSSKENLRDPECETSKAGRDRLSQQIQEYSDQGGNTQEACSALGVPRATHYGRLTPRAKSATGARKSNRALSEEEKQKVLDVLCEERFVDKSPPVVYALLLDEGDFLCSVSTMYRLLRLRDEVRERRNQARRPSAFRHCNDDTIYSALRKVG